MAPITFVDHVPAGLRLDSAVAGQGTCAISGQTATCTIDQLAAGQSVAVDVVVTPAARGFYANDVSVQAAALDPNAANDQASATLGVTSLAVDGCVVPRLRARARGGRQGGSEAARLPGRGDPSTAAARCTPAT